VAMERAQGGVVGEGGVGVNGASCFGLGGAVVAVRIGHLGRAENGAPLEATSSKSRWKVRLDEDTPDSSLLILCCEYAPRFTEEGSS